MLRFFGLVLAAIGMAGVAVALQARQTVDVLIRNGRVMDGSGNPWLRADIAIDGNRIVGVGDLSDHTAARTIDADDRVVAPGFIDVHSHAAEGLVRQALRQGQPLLAQGVTTIVANPDGGGPVDAAFKAIESIATSGAELQLYSVNNITSGTDAQGEVTVRLAKGGRIVNGQGADTDIVIASVKAYLNALNKLQAKLERAHPQL